MYSHAADDSIKATTRSADDSQLLDSVQELYTRACDRFSTSVLMHLNAALFFDVYRRNKVAFARYMKRALKLEQHFDEEFWSSATNATPSRRPWRCSRVMTCCPTSSSPNTVTP